MVRLDFNSHFMTWTMAYVQINVTRIAFLFTFLPVFRYPDATPEDLQASDNVCIICREEMVTGAKKLPCNHIFHSR